MALGDDLRPVPRVADVLLRACLGAEKRDRALGDLDDVFARVARTRGTAAARRACLREAVLMVAWSALDRARRLTETRVVLDRRLLVGSDFMQDVRHGMRSLLRRPGFTFVVVGVLGLGIGANVAIFTLADRLFLRPPPLIEAPGELVRLFRSWGVPNAGGSLSYPDYLDYRDGAATLRGLAAFSSSAYVATARADDAVSTANVLTITANYFDVLGVRPASGRFLRPEENRVAGGDPVAIVSHGFAAAQLGGDAVGRDVHLNGHRFTVVGVVPSGFRGLTPSGDPPDIYIPMLMRESVSPAGSLAWRQRLGNERERWVAVVGRMRPGVDVAAVRAELAPVADRIRGLEGADPEEGVLVSADIRWYPATAARLGGITRVLLAAVGLLLACATASVAILLLARASTRDREMGIRSALGAGRGRVVRQMLTESLLLGGAGCALGVAVAAVASRVAAALLPVTIDVPALPDVRMLVAALCTGLITALVVGIAPAWRTTRRDVLGRIQGRDRNAGGSRVRDALVVLQIALSLVLVAGATLFARSLAHARSIDPGFDPAGVLLIDVDLRRHGYDEARGRVFIDQALERLQSLPGVEVAAVTRMVPFRGDWTSDLEPWPGSRFAGGRAVLTTGMNAVSPDYFDLMRVPIVRGRGFDESSTPGIVVNETFARLAFDGEDALGRTVVNSSGQALTILGIARDALYYALDEDPWAQIYLPTSIAYVHDPTFAVRTEADPAALASAAQAALRAIDADVALLRTETLSSVHAEQYARFRATAHVVGLTGFIALVLASAGLYGVMAWRVNERRREIGLRAALGATRASLARGLVVRGLRLTLLGITLGTAAALLLGRTVEALLFRVQAADATSIVIAPLVLLAVALAALLLPARRAMQVDPMQAMRAD